ncbi:MAG: AraC family transcriptional regulator [Solirubrobacterales bacterium]
MDFLIENLPEYHIAYIRQTGPYGGNNVQVMENLKKWAGEHNLFNEDSIILGIAQDNPETTKPENCRYDTCIVVANDICKADNYVQEGILPGGKYVVFKINHTAEAVRDAWINIFPELVKQCCEFDGSRQIMERYVVKMVNNHLCEICVPIK